MKGASTGLNLTPREYLEMLTEEYRDYQEEWHANQYKVSMRKAINGAARKVVGICAA